MNEKLREYWERFGESFPLMCFQGCDSAEIIDAIDACLKDGKPYEPEKGLVY